MRALRINHTWISYNLVAVLCATTPSALADFSVDSDPLLAPAISPESVKSLAEIQREVDSLFYSAISSQLVRLHPVDALARKQVTSVDVAKGLTPMIGSLGPTQETALVHDVIQAHRSEPMFYAEGASEGLFHMPLVEQQNQQDGDSQFGSRYYEAFRPSLEIAESGVKSQMLSLEYPAVGAAHFRGWQRTRKMPLDPEELKAPRPRTDHWETVTWMGGGGPEGISDRVPLLARNSVRLLGLIAGVAIDESKGIVFGKIAKGWDVELPGESNRIIYLDLDDLREVRGPASVEKDRYFAIVNVTVGSRLIRVVRNQQLGVEPNQGSIGAVYGLVVAGAATYMDFSIIHDDKVVSGEVDLARGRDTEHSEGESLRGVSVRVSGVPAVAAETSADGFFDLDRVVTIGDYPIYIETQGPSMFSLVHRSRLMPWDLKHVVLTRLSSERLYSWLNDYSAARNGQAWKASNGLIVAAFPGLVNAYPDAFFVPKTKTLASADETVPHTYAVRANGSLDEPKQLSQYEERIVVAGVSNGMTLLSLSDLQEADESNSSDQLWSEAVPTEAGVVSIVGPY